MLINVGVRPKRTVPASSIEDQLFQQFYEDSHDAESTIKPMTWSLPRTTLLGEPKNSNCEMCLWEECYLTLLSSPVRQLVYTPNCPIIPRTTTSNIPSCQRTAITSIILILTNIHNMHKSILKGNVSCYQQFQSFKTNMTCQPEIKL